MWPPIGKQACRASAATKYGSQLMCLRLPSTASQHAMWPLLPPPSPAATPCHGAQLVPAAHLRALRAGAHQWRAATRPWPACPGATGRCSSARRSRRQTAAGRSPRRRRSGRCARRGRARWAAAAARPARPGPDRRGRAGAAGPISSPPKMNHAAAEQRALRSSIPVSTRCRPLQSVQSSTVCTTTTCEHMTPVEHFCLVLGKPW